MTDQNKKEIGMRGGIFRKKDLVKVKRTCCAETPAGGPFKIGQYVHLNSGSHDMVIVDFTATHAVVSWRDGGGDAKEKAFPLMCLHVRQHTKV